MTKEFWHELKRLSDTSSGESMPLQTIVNILLEIEQPTKDEIVKCINSKRQNILFDFNACYPMFIFNCSYLKDKFIIMDNDTNDIYMDKIIKSQSYDYLFNKQQSSVSDGIGGMLLVSFGDLNHFMANNNVDEIEMKMNEKINHIKWDLRKNKNNYYLNNKRIFMIKKGFRLFNTDYSFIFPFDDSRSEFWMASCNDIFTYGATMIRMINESKDFQLKFMVHDDHDANIGEMQALAKSQLKLQWFHNPNECNYLAYYKCYGVWIYSKFWFELKTNALKTGIDMVKKSVTLSNDHDKINVNYNTQEMKQGSKKQKKRGKVKRQLKSQKARQPEQQPQRQVRRNGKNYLQSKGKGSSTKYYRGRWKMPSNTAACDPPSSSEDSSD